MITIFIIIYLISTTICWFMIRSWRKENGIWNDSWLSFFKAIALSTTPLLNTVVILTILFAVIVDKIQENYPKPPKWL